MNTLEQWHRRPRPRCRPKTTTACLACIYLRACWMIFQSFLRNYMVVAILASSTLELRSFYTSVFIITISDISKRQTLCVWIDWDKEIYGERYYEARIFEKRPDDKTDYSLGCSFLHYCEHQVFVLTVECAKMLPPAGAGRNLWWGCCPIRSETFFWWFWNENRQDLDHKSIFIISEIWHTNFVHGRTFK